MNAVVFADLMSIPSLEGGEISVYVLSQPFEASDSCDLRRDLYGHSLTRGLFQVTPLCVGHEIIGRVIKVGKDAKTGVRVGDRVGVGAQVQACLQCKNCKSDNENYCPKQVGLYLLTSSCSRR